LPCNLGHYRPMKYSVERLRADGVLSPDWDAGLWAGLQTAELTHVRPEGSDHRPHVQVRLGYDGDQLCGIFRVEDRYVRSLCTGFQQSVCRDSCVEFFVQPAGGDAYFNFEFNAGGAMLAHYVTNPRHSAERPRQWVELSDADCEQVSVVSSLPSIIEAELVDPTLWTLAFAIPVAILEHHAGPIASLRGETWRANFYKCGDATSHPHWISWQPLDRVAFHVPEYFGDIDFA